jgi:calcineurin-like phosphoesterase family protein
MTIFYISDTHFDHKGIIKHAHRPFKDVSEMNETMIRNWNSRATNDDIIRHLGDFCWHDSDSEYFIKQLNGHIEFYEGNHDSSKTKKLFANNIQHNLMLYRVVDDGPYRIVLFHYPILDWDQRFHGSYHFYGHVHSTLEDLKDHEALDDIAVAYDAFSEKEARNYPLRDFNRRAFDVGVECLDYYPRTAEEIITRNFK